MSDPKLILDHVVDHEATQPERVFLTQPIGGGAVWRSTSCRAW